MRTFQINADIPENNLLVSSTADGTSNFKASILNQCYLPPCSRGLEPLFLR